MLCLTVPNLTPIISRRVSVVSSRSPAVASPCRPPLRVFAGCSESVDVRLYPCLLRSLLHIYCTVATSPPTKITLLYVRFLTFVAIPTPHSPLFVGSKPLLSGLLPPPCITHQSATPLSLLARQEPPFLCCTYTSPRPPSVAGCPFDPPCNRRRRARHEGEAGARSATAHVGAAHLPASTLAYLSASTGPLACLPRAASVGNAQCTWVGRGR